MLYCIVAKDSIYTPSKIIGTVLFIINTILIVKDNHKAEFLLLISLFLAIVNIATFTNSIFFFVIAGIGFDVVAFALFVLHFILNKKEIFEVIDDLRKD